MSMLSKIILFIDLSFWKKGARKIFAVEDVSLVQEEQNDKFGNVYIYIYIYIYYFNF